MANSLAAAHRGQMPSPTSSATRQFVLVSAQSWLVLVSSLGWIVGTGDTRTCTVAVSSTRGAKRALFLRARCLLDDAHEPCHPLHVVVGR
jgi:hypothetical protein